MSKPPTSACRSISAPDRSCRRDRPKRRDHPPQRRVLARLFWRAGQASRPRHLVPGDHVRARDDFVQLREKNDRLGQRRTPKPGGRFGLHGAVLHLRHLQYDPLVPHSERLRPPSSLTATIVTICWWLPSRRSGSSCQWSRGLSPAQGRGMTKWPKMRERMSAAHSVKCGAVRRG